MNNPIRILYINGGLMDRGGISAFMMNYYRHFDRSKLQVDFVVHSFEKGYCDDEIRESGGKIYNVPVKSLDYRGNIKALKYIFTTNNYKIVHAHCDAMSYIPLKIAKQCNIPVRIAHSHNTEHLTHDFIHTLLNEYARWQLKRYATHSFACSYAAGQWLFGKHKFSVLNNAINIEQFVFKQGIRDKIRQELGVENDFVIGHIGRFDYQKNHSFLINIFSEISKRQSNAKLVLVGEGHLQNDIKEKVNEYNLNSKVLFLGSRQDVNKLLNAFDLFVLPSLFEGLGIVAIEAQTNGLQVIVSDKVPQDVNITGNVTFLPLERDIWIKELSKNAQEKSNHTNSGIDVKQSGYDITVEAQKLQNFYLNL